MITKKTNQNLTYKDKFIQMNKEAKATLIASLIIFAYFWLTIYLFQDNLEFGMILGLPLWFTLSCLGGYLLSIIVVFILVKFFMANFDLD